MKEQARSRLDNFGDVDGRVLDRARAAEVQKPVRYLLATKSLAAYELKVLAQVFNVRARAVSVLCDARLKCFGARGDGRERVVDFVYDARGQTPDGGEPLRPRDGAVRLDARRDVFADGDDVRDLFAVNLHRDFADEPVARRAVGRLRLLLYVFDLAGRERALELAPQSAARLAR